MSKKYLLLILISLTAIILLSCKEKAETDWDNFVNNFIESYFAQNPEWASLNGRHEFDGQISDYSDKGIKERVGWFKKQKELTENFSNTVLTSEQILEKENLLVIINANLFFIETLRKPYTNADYYRMPLAPSNYLEKNYAPLKQRMKGYIKYLRALIITVGQIQDNFMSETSIPQSYIEVAKQVFGGFADFIKNDAPKGFAEVKDKEMSEEFNKATDDVVDKLNEFVKWLNTKMPDAPKDFAMGEEKFSRMLKIIDCLDIPLEQLKKMAEDDLNRNLSGLKIACEKYSPGKSVEECIQEQQSEKPKVSCIEEASEQLPFLEKLINEENIASIPNYSELFVRESPSFSRGYGAHIILPRAYDKEMIGIYYIDPIDPKWTKEEIEKYTFSKNTLLFISIHEIWPGHFLQSLYFNNCKSPLAKVFKDYTCLEGWAHYTEEMMYDEGLGNYQPEYEIAMRLEALMRSVRFVVSLKMHTEGMSIDDAAEMFMKLAYMDKISARQNAFRGTYDPQYYGYTLGKILIRNLKNEWMTKTGSSDLNEFHNKFLSYGVIPISLIEKSMLMTN